ncbi:hypothetical protein QBC35DRAFT_23655 [Podospora australis]|uniref:Uncharacterized protein n=1 Tax=Podospora australis TaxID=1536484 RepID=A0AAN7AMT0_9PEZI|nr:hypothetical protein QBC35DRAFT_23655 [Podospora australis]
MSLLQKRWGQLPSDPRMLTRAWDTDPGTKLVGRFSPIVLGPSLCLGWLGLKGVHPPALAEIIKFMDMGDQESLPRPRADRGNPKMANKSSIDPEADEKEYSFFFFFFGLLPPMSTVSGRSSGTGATRIFVSMLCEADPKKESCTMQVPVCFFLFPFIFPCSGYGFFSQPPHPATFNLGMLSREGKDLEGSGSLSYISVIQGH